MYSRGMTVWMANEPAPKTLELEYAVVLRPCGGARSMRSAHFIHFHVRVFKQCFIQEGLQN